MGKAEVRTVRGDSVETRRETVVAEIEFPILQGG